jgi:flavin reductase (DIM6/NTAB) family NADH-FMN oxidoreductase RutF
VSVDTKSLHRLLLSAESSMIVVTAATGSRRSGCLVGFSTQCSVDPVRFLVCLSKRNATYRIAQESPVLAVHLLTQHDGAVAELFGGQTSDDTDKLQQVDWEPGPHGVPVLAAGAGAFVGEVLDRYDVGDHVAFVLDPVAVYDRDVDAPPLRFGQVKDMEPGHEP